MSIELAARILHSGGLVVFPTETVYGVGADATNPRAVAAIFAAKGRPQFNPLISHVLSLADAERHAELHPVARMLIEKFHSIKELTVPAWKRQFMLALSLQEQKSAVELAHKIDDATNQFLRENARLLKDNTINTARANQRSVIDVATLQEVHESLMSTVQEVVRINQEGVQQRSAAAGQLLTMRQQMTQQMGAGG